MLNCLHFNWDKIGICASTLCMIHCLAFPLLVAAIPWLCASATTPSIDCPACAKDDCCTGKVSATAEDCCSTPLDFWVHVGLIAGIAPVGVAAWVAGFKRHRRAGVLWLGTAALVLLMTALLVDESFADGRGEQWLTVSGSMGMVAAHLWNRRQCRCCAPLEANKSDAA